MKKISGKPYIDTTDVLENLISSYVLMGWTEEKIRKEFEVILRKVISNKNKI